jgi:hypothetical protein
MWWCKQVDMYGGLGRENKSGKVFLVFFVNPILERVGIILDHGLWSR